MKKTKIMDVDFKDLVEKISTDDIVLPDFQRGFVWRQKENQAALLASVLTKLPIGTILLLEIDPKSYACKKIGLCNSRPEIEEKRTSVNALLDGQQRVTVLTAFFSNKLEELANGDKFVSPSLGRRYFIKVPKFSPKEDDKDLFGWKILIAPKEIREKQCPKNYSTNEMKEHIFCIEGEKYKKILHGDIGNVNQDDLLGLCTEHKIDEDGYLIPLYYLFGASKNQKKYLERFEAVLQRIGERYVNEILDFLKKEEDSKTLSKYIKECFDEPGKSSEIEADEQENLRRISEDLISDLQDGTEQIKDEESELFERVKKTLSGRVDSWKRDVSGFLISCIEEMELYKIEIEQSDVIRAIDIYENLNLGGKALDVFDLLLARAAMKPEEGNLLENIKNYIFADHKEEYSMFVANCIDAQSNAYEEFVKYKISYSASEQMESWDEKENQMVPIYCTTLMSTTGVLNYFAKVENEQLKIDFYDERKKESFTNQVTKSEYLLKEIPVERISVLVTKAVKGLDRACLFLQLRCGLRKVTEVAYKLMLVVLSTIFTEDSFFNNKRIVGYIEAWYWSVILSGGFDRKQNQAFQESMKSLLSIISKEMNHEEEKKLDYIVHLTDRVFCNKEFADEEILLMENKYVKPEDTVGRTICQFYLSRTYMDILQGVSSKNYKPGIISVFSEENRKEGLQRHHIMPKRSLDAVQNNAQENGDKYDSPLNWLMISAKANQLISNNELSYYIAHCNNSTLVKIGNVESKDVEGNNGIDNFLRKRFKGVCADLYHVFCDNLPGCNIKEFYEKAKMKDEEEA